MVHPIFDAQQACFSQSKSEIDLPCLALLFTYHVYHQNIGIGGLFERVFPDLHAQSMKAACLSRPKAIWTLLLEAQLA